MRTIHLHDDGSGATMLVRRDAEGYPKAEEGGATYISRTAWQKRGPVATQTVRRLAGLSKTSPQ